MAEKEGVEQRRFRYFSPITSKTGPSGMQKCQFRHQSVQLIHSIWPQLWSKLWSSRYWDFYCFTIHDPTFLDPTLSMTPRSVSSFINSCMDLREMFITEASSACVTDGFSRSNNNRYSRSDSVPASICALKHAYFSLFLFLQHNWAGCASFCNPAPIDRRYLHLFPFLLLSLLLICRTPRYMLRSVLSFPVCTFRFF